MSLFPNLSLSTDFDVNLSILAGLATFDLTANFIVMGFSDVSGTCDSVCEPLSISRDLPFYSGVAIEILVVFTDT